MANNYNHREESETMNNSRGRIELRKVYVYEFPGHVDTQGWGEYIGQMVKVERRVKRFDTRSKRYIDSFEEAYYISTVKLSASDYNQVIREHWGIENRDHYVRDTAMEEDKSRIRKNSEIMSKLRSIALNVMRANKVKNIRNELFANAQKIDRLWRYRYLLN